jgi:hypothetical protein
MDLSRLFDFGDDWDVEKAIRSWNPHSVMATYPSGEVKRALWVRPNETRTAMDFGRTPSRESLLLNFDGESLREEFGATAGVFADAGYEFSNFVALKRGSRTRALEFLVKLDCTVRDLHRMGFEIESEEERRFLKTEMHLRDSDLERLEPKTSFSL